VVLVVVGLVGADAAAEDAATQHDGSSLLARLDLPQAGSLAGRLVDAPAEAIGSRTTLLWQSPVFAGPFEFALDGIVGIRFPQPENRRLPEAAGDWLIELVSGDQFAGGIESIDERHVVATIGSAASPARLVVRRDAVKRVFRGKLGATFIGIILKCMNSFQFSNRICLQILQRLDILLDLQILAMLKLFLIN